MYLLGIDFGGGSSKATLLDESGKILATSSSEYQTIYGADGKAEQNPIDWFNAAINNIKNILAKGYDPEEIKALCFDAATHTAVLLDENDDVIAPSIYWTDIRSKDEVKFLNDNYRDYIFNKCKHEPSTIWTLPELMYFKKENPEAFKKIKHILFAKDYVRHMFTKGYVTDYIEAEGSMLFDFDKRVWDEKLLDILSLSKDVMPEIKNPMDIIGTINEEASKLSGLSTKTKVLCGSTDTAMEVFASGGIRKGDTTIKLATAGRICLVLDKYVADKAIINYSHLIDGLYYPGSATKSCASSLRWFRDTFGQSFEELSNMANEIAPGSDGLLYLPYLLGEISPIASSSVRATFFGISASHTKAHFVRALMEGVSLSLLDSVYYLNEKGLSIEGNVYILGGGGNSPIWRQITSDVLGLPVKVVRHSDSSFGSAMLAGIALGVFKDHIDAFNKCNEIVSITEPDMKKHEIYREIYKKYKKVQNYILDYYEE